MRVRFLLGPVLLDELLRSLERILILLPDVLHGYFVLEFALDDLLVFSSLPHNVSQDILFAR